MPLKRNRLWGEIPYQNMSFWESLKIIQLHNIVLHTYFGAHIQKKVNTYVWDKYYANLVS